MNKSFSCGFHPFAFYIDMYFVRSSEKKVEPKFKIYKKKIYNVMHADFYLEFF